MIQRWFRPGTAFNEREKPKPLRWGDILPPFLMILAMWTLYWADMRFGLEMSRLGIYPKATEGLWGIVLSPLIHGNIGHLANNTFPILVLGTALYYFYPRKAHAVMIISWLASGLAVWFIGRESFHIGASGLVYALAGFIFLSGVLREKAQLLALSLLVAFIYGSMVWGLLPVEERISYEAHGAGAGVGLLLAIIYRSTAPKGAEQRPTETPDDDLSEQIAKYGDEYWKDHSGERAGTQIRYHYLPRKDD